MKLQLVEDDVELARWPEMPMPMPRQRKTVSKAMLVQNTFSLDDAPSAEAIDIYIHRLRKHLANSSAQIMTPRRLGYIVREHDP